MIDELEKLEQEEVDAQMINTNINSLPNIPTPAVPTHVPSNPQPVAQEEDDGLNELEQWMTS